MAEGEVFEHLRVDVYGSSDGGGVLRSHTEAHDGRAISQHRVADFVVELREKLMREHKLETELAAF